MNIQTTLLILFGITVLSTNGFAKSIEKQEPQKYPVNSNIHEEKKHREKQSEQIKPVPKLKYNPPFLGAPSTARLVGMALRGQGQNDDELLFSVLAPTHTGLTSQVQPELYWYTSHPVSESFQFIEFVLTSKHSISPVLKTRLPSVTKAGVLKIRLSDYDINLQPGTEYTWSIALVPDPESRSHDYVTSGKIKHIELPKELQKKVSKASADQYPYIFSHAGFWYDAIAAIIHQTVKHPKDSSNRDDLTSLMEQVRLHQIAVSMRDSANWAE